MAKKFLLVVWLANHSLKKPTNTPWILSSYTNESRKRCLIIYNTNLEHYAHFLYPRFFVFAILVFTKITRQLDFLSATPRENPVVLWFLLKLGSEKQKTSDKEIVYRMFTLLLIWTEITILSLVFKHYIESNAYWNCY